MMIDDFVTATTTTMMMTYNPSGRNVRLVVVVGFCSDANTTLVHWTMMERNASSFLPSSRANELSSRVVVVVVVLGGLQSAFTLYLTKKGEISVKISSCV